MIYQYFFCLRKSFNVIKMITLKDHWFELVVVVILALWIVIKTMVILNIFKSWKYTSETTTTKGEPRYPRSFYLRICILTSITIVYYAKFLVKMCLLLANSMSGPIKWDVSTSNNEAHLYFLTTFTHYDRFKKSTHQYWQCLI